VDNGIATAAESGVYGPEGQWLIEGHGVEPDIVVDNLPHTTFAGNDEQLDAAIRHLQERIRAEPIKDLPPPAFPRKAVPRGPPPAAPRAPRPIDAGHHAPPRPPRPLDRTDAPLDALPRRDPPGDRRALGRRVHHQEPHLRHDGELHAPRRHQADL